MHRSGNEDEYPNGGEYPQNWLSAVSEASTPSMKVSELSKVSVKVQTDTIGMHKSVNEDRDPNSLHQIGF